MGAPLYLVGEKYGRLTVTAHIRDIPGKGKIYLCTCECGKTIESYASVLRSGNTTSCGCSREKHGHNKDKLHVIWRMILNRCNNPKSDKYKDYGGRGIKVDVRWLDFNQFKSDMGDRPEGHTVERKDNEQGYSKDNCVWADAKTQARNRRSTKLIEFNGQRKILKDWADEYGVNYSTAKGRYASGLPFEKVLGL